MLTFKEGGKNAIFGIICGVEVVEGADSINIPWNKQDGVAALLTGVWNTLTYQRLDWMSSPAILE